MEEERMGFRRVLAKHDYIVSRAMEQAFADHSLPKLSYTQPEHAAAILKELNEQRKTRSFCDVVLKVEEVEIAGHRAVLSSAFPNLRTSLQNRKDCRIFEIDGLKCEAVEALVEFSYTSHLDVQPDFVFPVLLAARKFGMAELENILEAFAVESILPRLWLVVWKFADRFDFPRLRSAVEKFIADNTESLYQKQDFLRLPHLQVELARRQGNRKNNLEPKEICEKAVLWIQSQLQEEDNNLSVLLEHTHIMYLTSEGNLKECTAEDLDGDMEKFIATDAQMEYIRQSSIEQLSKADPHVSDDEGIMLENNNVRKRKMSPFSGDFKVLSSIHSSESDFFGFALVNGKVTALSIHQQIPISSHNSTSSESSGYEDWSLIASMSRGRCSVGAAELSGKLYAVGGYDRGACLDTVEVYDPQTNEWMPAAHLHSNRGRFELGVLGDKIYAIGGSDGHNELNTVECYNMDTDNWSLKAPMGYCRSSLGTAVLDNHLYAIGGYSGSHNLKTVERYDPSSDKWQQVASLSCGRDNLCAEALDGKVYAIGGYNGWSYFNTVECYNPLKDTWTFIAPMKTARRGAGVAAVGGCLYVVGGYDGTSFLNSVECYNPQTNTWTTVASMNTARHNVGVAVIGGQIYAVGGFNGSAFLKTMETYDPNTNKWKSFVLAQ